MFRVHLLPSGSGGYCEDIPQPFNAPCTCGRAHTCCPCCPCYYRF